MIRRKAYLPMEAPPLLRDANALPSLEDVKANQAVVEVERLNVIVTVAPTPDMWTQLVGHWLLVL